jgi:hypothetical protein
LPTERADVGLRRAEWPPSRHFSYAIAPAFGFVRIHLTAVGLIRWVLAVLLAQRAVLATGWTHTVRLFAVAELARSLLWLRRHGSAPPPALQG